MNPLIKCTGEDPRAYPRLGVQAVSITTSLLPSRSRSSQSDCRVDVNVRIVLLPQGPGFAAVASKVWTLASRNTQATKRIEGLISGSVKLVDLGSDEVTTTGETMCTIVDATASVTHIMQEIATASGEQSRGIAQVSQAISEMDKVTQQNTSLIEEISAVAVFLKEQAVRLTEAVDVFRLNKHSVSTKSRGACEPISSATV